MGVNNTINIGIMYPREWEQRDSGQLAADLDLVREIDHRIEILDTRYQDPEELRTKRGADPSADHRSEAPTLTPDQTEALSRVEIVIAQDLPFDVASVAPNLRWVQGMGAGVSQLESAGLEYAGIALTSAAGVNAVSISEFVFARVLQIWKRLPEIDALQTQRHWSPTYGKEVAGTTLGIVGLGAIGRQVARLGRGFGMRVVASRASAAVGDSDPDVDELWPPTHIQDVLATADVVVAAVPESSNTIDLFSAKQFAQMRPGSIFCNVGRGSAVVTDDLIEALRSGHLRAGILDVVRNEPLGVDDPLWSVPGLFISPHSATSPDRFWENLYQLFRENLRNYLAGEPLKNLVLPLTQR